MKQCVAIIAALPREIKPLVRGWTEHRLPGNVIAYTNEYAVVACAGMGADRATLAVKAAISMKPVTALLSVGLAGACDPSLKVGSIVRAGVVIDTRTGEQFSNSQYKQVLVSASTIASVQEKARLHAAYRASAVDMEAAAVARLAEAHGLFFAAIKAISDEADFEMQELGQFATADGQFREAAFAMHTVVRPRLWKKLMSLASNSTRAISALTTALEEELRWYRERS